MRQYVRIAKHVYRVGDSVFFRAMIGGKRKCFRPDIQGALAIDSRGRATALIKRQAIAWYSGAMNESFLQESWQNLRVPTFGEIIETYHGAAAESRIKCGKPKNRTEENAVKAFTALVAGCGYRLEDPSDKLTTRDMEKFVVAAVQGGMAAISAWSYVGSCQSVSPKWSKLYFEEKGFKYPDFKKPDQRKNPAPRYERPTAEQLKEVDAWYAQLAMMDDKRMALFALFMRYFAMRNSDVRLLEWGNFLERDGKVWLSYTPEKTKNSSGRPVCVFVSPERWKTIQELAGGKKGKGDRLFGSTRMLEAKLCAGMRLMCPWLDGKDKTLYELRKICVDHVYHKFGPQAASAISGDDIRTIMYYYADPSAAGEQLQVTSEMLLEA